MPFRVFSSLALPPHFPSGFVMHTALLLAFDACTLSSSMLSGTKEASLGSARMARTHYLHGFSDSYSTFMALGSVAVNG